jgi:hypothetical protein
MRTTTLLVGASLTLVLAGCSGGVRLTSVPAGCNASTSITVQHGPGRIDVGANECINVSGGSPVTLTFEPIPAVGQVRTKFKGLGNRWLDRSNDSGNAATITLPVPRNDDEGDVKSYKYEIHVRGVGVLDPRIIVQ